MRKRLPILVAVFAIVAAGCTSTLTARHGRITPAPTTQPRDAVDPETGAPLWKDFADRNFSQSLSRKDAFKILLNTEIFADAYVGYAGSKSVQVEAFQVLLARPDAMDVFSDLLHRANTAGKLYALCAFYLLAPEKYADAEKQVVMQSPATVDQLSGCIIHSSAVREIIRCSDPNTVRLRPGETVKQWFARVKPPGDSAMFDISGGAIPEEFQEAR